MDLEAGKLYIMSAPPGCGKSTILKKSGLPSDMVVSSDELRKQILGSKTINNTEFLFDDADNSVFNIMEIIISERLKQGLTTIVDSTNTTDSDRNTFVSIANSFGIDSEILILDVNLDTAISRNKNRLRAIPESSIERFFNKFQKTSKFKHRLISDTDTLSIIPRAIPDNKIDVVGDVHGLYDDFLLMIGKLGYVVNDGIAKHPENRKLLFLGDFIDRGTQSIEMLQFVYKNVKHGGHYSILGNHENKLLRFDRVKSKNELSNWNSLSNAETAVAFMKLNPKEQTSLIEFLKYLPSSFVFEPNKIAFVHADISWFDPFKTPKSNIVYGESNFGQFDSDAEYDKNYATGVNKYTLVRGHIPQVSTANSVFSVEYQQAFNGHLAILQLDKFINSTHWDNDKNLAFNEALVLHKTNFDFDIYAKKYDLLKGLSHLESKKLVTSRQDPSNGLRIFKYSKKVFFDALWNEDELLKKARGIVLDLAGNIVQHPFDKYFNYGENSAGLDLAPDTKLTVVDKMNGFLGAITLHPYKPWDLLVTTSGSFDSDFTKYINDYIDDILKKKLIEYLKQNNYTLLFEVIHPEDPHIIKYDQKEQGLWLIGVRGKNITDKELPENQVDDVAKILGFKRPQWQHMQLDQLLELTKTSQLEGYMARLGNDDFAFKIKTPFYLTTKFLGRMNNNKIKHMFNQPEAFKKDLDEEFYPIVDYLISIGQDRLLTMDEQEKIELLRTFTINNLVCANKPQNNKPTKPH